MHPHSNSIAVACILVMLASLAAPRLVPALPAPVGVAGLVIGSALGVYSLLRWRREQAVDAATRAISRRYLRDSLAAMLAYMLAVGLSVWLLHRIEGVALRTLVALLPVPAIAMTLRATARYIRGLDELQRRIELESIALGSVGVALVYFTGALLQVAKVTDVSAATAMLWVLPALGLGYGIAKVGVMRHYA